MSFTMRRNFIAFFALAIALSTSHSLPAMEKCNGLVGLLAWDRLDVNMPEVAKALTSHDEVTPRGTWIEDLAVIILELPENEIKQIRSPVARWLIQDVQRLAQIYTPKQVAERLVGFLAREGNLFEEVGKLVDDTISENTPDIYDILRGSRSQKDFKKMMDKLKKEQGDGLVIRSLSWFTDRLRVSIIDMNDRYGETDLASLILEQQEELDAEEAAYRTARDTIESAQLVRGKYARSKIFGPNGVSYLVDTDIKPLRQEDHRVMQVPDEMRTKEPESLTPPR